MVKSDHKQPNNPHHQYAGYRMYDGAGLQRSKNLDTCSVFDKLLSSMELWFFTESVYIIFESVDAAQSAEARDCIEIHGMIIFVLRPALEWIVDKVNLARVRSKGIFVDWEINISSMMLIIIDCGGVPLFGVVPQLEYTDTVNTCILWLSGNKPTPQEESALRCWVSQVFSGRVFVLTLVYYGGTYWVVARVDDFREKKMQHQAGTAESTAAMTSGGGGAQGLPRATRALAAPSLSSSPSSATAPATATGSSPAQQPPAYTNPQHQQYAPNPPPQYPPQQATTSQSQQQQASGVAQPAAQFMGTTSSSPPAGGDGGQPQPPAHGAPTQISQYQNRTPSSQQQQQLFMQSQPPQPPSIAQQQYQLQQYQQQLYQQQQQQQQQHQAQHQTYQTQPVSGSQYTSSTQANSTQPVDPMLSGAQARSKLCKILQKFNIGHSSAYLMHKHQLRTQKNEARRDAKSDSLPNSTTASSFEVSHLSAAAESFISKYGPYAFSTFTILRGFESDGLSSSSVPSASGSESSGSEAEQNLISTDFLDHKAHTSDSDSDYLRDVAIFTEEELTRRRKQKIQKLLKLYKLQFHRLRDLLRVKHRRYFLQRRQIVSESTVTKHPKRKRRPREDVDLQLIEQQQQQHPLAQIPQAMGGLDYTSMTAAFAQQYIPAMMQHPQPDTHGTQQLQTQSTQQTMPSTGETASQQQYPLQYLSTPEDGMYSAYATALDMLIDPQQRMCAISGCTGKALIQSMYCIQHILKDPKQKTFRQCTYSSNGVTCPNPVLVSEVSTVCATHSAELKRMQSQTSILPTKRRRPEEPEPQHTTQPLVSDPYSPYTLAVYEKISLMVQNIQAKRHRLIQQEKVQLSQQDLQQSMTQHLLAQNSQQFSVPQQAQQNTPNQVPANLLHPAIQESFPQLQSSQIQMQLNTPSLPQFQQILTQPADQSQFSTKPDSQNPLLQQTTPQSARVQQNNQSPPQQILPQIKQATQQQTVNSYLTPQQQAFSVQHQLLLSELAQSQTINLQQQNTHQQSPQPTNTPEQQQQTPQQAPMQQTSPEATPHPQILQHSPSTQSDQHLSTSTSSPSLS
ncbi:hypothetical protein Pelo_8072 [Pelomyxa schiedti]|nr:hypothetical protein Pelo_8072 [Pelomyxa schiedti]